MTIFRSTALFVLLACAAAAPVGCKEQAQESGAAVAAPVELSVGQVSKLLGSAHPPRIYDANSNETREEYGVLPGATLLESPNRVQAVLPADKGEKLVFYCGSTRCKAAEGAARKALGAGYRDVNVMPAGIKGWKEAGKTTQSVEAAGS